MKQIETGCLAIVVGAIVAENNGKVVTVGKYIGEVPEFEQKTNWEVSCPLMTTRGVIVYYAPQSKLLRIDGEEFFEEELVEELELTGSDYK